MDNLIALAKVSNKEVGRIDSAGVGYGILEWINSFEHDITGNDNTNTIHFRLTELLGTEIIAIKTRLDELAALQEQSGE